MGKNIGANKGNGLNLGLVNIRDMKPGKFESICQEMEANMLDILMLTQTTLRGDINNVHKNYRFLGKGRVMNGRQGGGVGIIVDESKGILVEELDLGTGDVEGEDIVAYKFQGIKGIKKGANGDFVLIVCYMTVEGPNWKENCNKYKILETVSNKFKNERVIIAGDMNGHTGILGEKTNKNGEMLLNFVDICNLEILNHTIGQGKITWKNRLFESTIDYILVNENARELVHEMIVDEDGLMDMDTDHNVLILNYGFKGNCDGNTKENNNRSGFKWMLKGVTYENFQMDLSELDCILDNNPNIMNDELIKKINVTAGKSFKKSKINNKNQKKYKSWWNKDIGEAIEERKKQNRILRTISKNKNKGKATENEYDIGWENLLAAKKQVNHLVALAIEKEEHETLKSIRNQGDGEARDWYNFIRGKNNSAISNCKSIRVEGKILTERNDIKVEIEKFWGNICGDGNKVGKFIHSCNMELSNGRKNFVMDHHSPSIEEIKKALKKLKNNKGVGMDGVPYEFFKNGGDWMVKALYDVYKRVWEDECVPTKWNESKVILLHKGGNKNKQLLQNYRPISLGNTIGKIFCSIINERVMRVCEDFGVLGEEQNGFRKGRRGEDNIYIVKELIDKHNRLNHPLYIAFMDIEKAYDRVNRRTLNHILINLGFPQKISNIIRTMYRNTKSKFLLGDIETDWVKLERGVRQGCVLSPLLFSIYTEELAARIRESGLGIRVGEGRLGILLYADDVVLLGDSKEMLQEMINIVRDYGNEFSLSFNNKKCGILAINTPQGKEHSLK